VIHSLSSSPPSGQEGHRPGRTTICGSNRTVASERVTEESLPKQKKQSEGNGTWDYDKYQFTSMVIAFFDLLWTDTAERITRIMQDRRRFTETPSGDSMLGYQSQLLARRTDMNLSGRSCFTSAAVALAASIERQQTRRSIVQGSLLARKHAFAIRSRRCLFATIMSGNDPSIRSAKIVAANHTGGMPSYKRASCPSDDNARSSNTQTLGAAPLPPASSISAGVQPADLTQHLILTKSQTDAFFPEEQPIREHSQLNIVHPVLPYRRENY